MFVENVSMVAIKHAHHYDPGPNSLLIQIVDPDMDHPVAKYPFKETRKYKFLDVEGQEYLDAITEKDALDIAKDLLHAKEKGMNIIVHCVAGICRSGAVVEAALSLGYQETDTWRSANLYVKEKLLNSLKQLQEK